MSWDDVNSKVDTHNKEMMHYFKNPPKPSVRINRYKINFILFFLIRFMIKN